MNEFDFDLFVIGAGSGGVRAARVAARLGAKVAVAEENYLGGTCVNVGCVPKKLFVYASQFSQAFKNSAGFGWQMEQALFNLNQLITNKNLEIQRLNNVYQQLLENSGVEIFAQRATIVDDNTITLDERKISARYILIATGGWPVMPDLPGIELAISSNEAFFLEYLPKQVIVVGGGYIAVEFAGIFNGLGIDTSIVYRGPLFLKGFDGEIREFLAKEMEKCHITMEFNSNVERIDSGANGLSVRLTDHRSLSADTVMFATGRLPNTRGIGLENVGVDTDSQDAIIVDNNYQTSNPSFYAIGDVTNRINLTPVALAEGIAVANYLFNDDRKPVDYHNVPSCVFSQPNLGTVGLNEETARENFDDIVIFRSEFTPLKHTLSKSAVKNLMKMIVDKKTDRVLGVHMVGEDAGEIIQGIAIALKAGATKSVFDATIGIHPTAAEEFVTMRTASR